MWDIIRSHLEMEQAFLGDRVWFMQKKAVPSEHTLQTLEKHVSSCQKCPLASTRTQTVFGEGSPHARLVFVGEAPGAEEDKTGIPFVGKAGQLLTRMIVAMGMTREDVYIANILKCRPPGNRDPKPHEISVCMGYVAEQLRLIAPKVICTLGAFATKTLLRTETPISRLRGQVHHWQDTMVVPTFHPAYLLRNASMKKQAWEDLQLVMQLLRQTPS